MTEHRLIAGHEGFMIGDDGVVWTCWGNRRHKNHARLRSSWTRLDHWEIVEPLIRVGKYPTVSIGTRYCVHVLVLNAFVGPCPIGYECRHLNDDRYDNRLENLKWGTPKENCADRVKHGLQFKHTDIAGSKNPMATIDEDDVREIRLLEGKFSRMSIARYIGCSCNTVNCVLNGTSWKHVK